MYGTSLALGDEQDGMAAEARIDQQQLIHRQCHENEAAVIRNHFRGQQDFVSELGVLDGGTTIQRRDIMRRNSRWASRAGVVGLMISGLVFGGWSSGNAFDEEQSSPTDRQGLSQSWDKKLPSTSRFTVLTDFGGAAVRDNETGLVWEQSPETKTVNWSAARFHCTTRKIGGRMGWRLPSVHELASLVDPSVSPGPTLPAGHPFTNVQAAHYWSATSFAGKPSHAWNVGFVMGMVHDIKVADSHNVWCVRGGNNADAY
jgi:Protein of unknown function (DUF1566)